MILNEFSHICFTIEADLSLETSEMPIVSGFVIKNNNTNAS